MKKFNFIFFLLTLLVSGTIVNAQSATWTNATNDDNWHNEDNWDTTVIPSSSDQVIIPANSIVNIHSSNALANNLTVEEGAIVTVYGGNLVMSQGTFAPGSELNMLGGIVQVSGTLVINSVLNTIGVNAKSLIGAGANAAINITGTMHVHSPSDPLTLHNVKLDIFPSGTLTIEEGEIIGSGLLYNRGLFQKTAGTGTFSIQSNFENDEGIVNINSGSIETKRITTLNGGEINIAENSSFAMNSFTSSNYLNGTLSGQLDGPFIINSQTRLLGTTETVLNFYGPAGVEWRKGSIVSAGGINTNTTIVNQGLLTITDIGTGELALSGGITLRNEADIFINGTATSFHVYSTSLLNNADTGEITVEDNVNIIGSVLNTGLFQKLTGTGEVSINSFTNNAPGILDIVSGQFNCLDNYDGSGFITGAGTIKTNPTDMVASTIAPGNAGVGTLTYLNLAEFEALPGCVYQLEINGTTPDTEHDVFAIDSNAKLDGTFSIQLGFAPQLTDEFVVITANNILSCNLPAQVTADFNGNTYTFDVNCNADNVTLGVNTISLGIDDNTLASAKAYPNPTTGNFNINLGENHTEIHTTITNILGQTIASQKFENTNTIQLQIKEATGIYFVNVETEGQSKMFKILKN